MGSSVEVIETTQGAVEHRVPIQEPVIEKAEVLLNYGEFKLKMVIFLFQIVRTDYQI